MGPDPVSMLPHRPPFRFLTSAAPSALDTWTGVWIVSGREDFFAGHFPGDPILPGVLLAEALAQLSGLVAFHGSDRGRPGRLVHVDVRFDAAVRPPAEVLLRSRMERRLGSLARLEVSAMVGGATVASGWITLAEVAGGVS